MSLSLDLQTLTAHHSAFVLCVQTRDNIPYSLARTYRFECWFEWKIEGKNIFWSLYLWVCVFYFCCGTKILQHRNLSEQQIVVKILFKYSRLWYCLCQLQLKTWKLTKSAVPTLIYSRSLDFILEIRIYHHFEMLICPIPSKT